MTQRVQVVGVGMIPFATPSKTEPYDVMASTAARLALEDAGIGIEPQMLPRLFQMFSQAPSSLQRAQGGLGVGLSLTRGEPDVKVRTAESAGFDDPTVAGDER